jgi:orotate phosphoribosyltransferase
MFSSDLLSSLPIRSGHFLLESGYHSNLWFSLDSLLVDTTAMNPLVVALADKLRPHQVTAVCGPMLGGAFLALAVARELGVRFYFATGPYHTSASEGLFKARYSLPHEQRMRVRGERVALVDDAISAGSSVLATKAALDESDASAVVIGTLFTLGTAGRTYFENVGIPLEALSHREFTMWKPAECPMCAAGAPLIDAREEAEN